MAEGQQQQVSLNVPMNMIIDQLHAKYGNMLARMMQENAELQAGVEVLGNENQELRAKAVMLGDQLARANDVPFGRDATDGPGGSGLLGLKGQATFPGVSEDGVGSGEYSGRAGG